MLAIIFPFLRRFFSFADITPGDSHAIAVAQVYPRDQFPTITEHQLLDGHEPLHLVHQIVPPQQQLHTVIGGQEPAAAVTQLQLADHHALRTQQAAELLVLTHHLALGALGAVELRQLAETRNLLWFKRLAFIVQQRLVAPTGYRQLLIQSNHQLVRPNPANRRIGYPGHGQQICVQACQIDTEEAVTQVRLYHLLDGVPIDVLQLTLNADQCNRPVCQGHQPAAKFVQPHTERDQQQRPEQVLRTANQAAQVGARQTQTRQLPRLGRGHTHGTTPTGLTAR